VTGTFSFFLVEHKATLLSINKLDERHFKEINVEMKTLFCKREIKYI